MKIENNNKNIDSIEALKLYLDFNKEYFELELKHSDLEEDIKNELNSLISKIEEFKNKIEKN